MEDLVLHIFACETVLKQQNGFCIHFNWFIFFKLRKFFDIHRMTPSYPSPSPNFQWQVEQKIHAKIVLYFLHWPGPLCVKLWSQDAKTDFSLNPLGSDLIFGSFGNEPMQSCSVRRVSLSLSSSASLALALASVYSPPSDRFDHRSFISYKYMQLCP